MALDWRGRAPVAGPSRRARDSYPTKTSINLYVPDSQDLSLRRAVPAGILLAVLVALFVKFGVVDQLAQVTQRQEQLARQEQLVSAVEGQLADYDTVKDEYDSYSESGSSEASAVAVLALVDSQVRTSANVTSVSLKDDVLTLALSDVSLDTVGTLAGELKAQDMVSGVSVSTASSSSNASDVAATMVVSLVSAQG